MNFKFLKCLVLCFILCQFIKCTSPTNTLNDLSQIESGLYAIRLNYTYNNSDSTNAPFLQNAKLSYEFLFNKDGSVTHRMKYFDSTNGIWIPTVDFYWIGKYECNDRYLSIKYQNQKDDYGLREVIKSTTYKYQYKNDTLILSQQRVWHGNSIFVIGKWYLNAFDNYEPGLEGGDTIDFKDYMNFKDDGIVEIGKTINQLDSVTSSHEYFLKNDTLDIPDLWEFKKSTFIIINGKLIVSYFRDNTVKYIKE
jgi:hypothetical protein